MKRADAVDAVREGKADWSDPTDQRRLLVRPKILQVRGKLGIWAPIGPPAIMCEGEGFGPKFCVMQLI